MAKLHALRLRTRRKTSIEKLLGTGYGKEQGFKVRCIFTFVLRNVLGLFSRFFVIVVSLRLNCLFQVNHSNGGTFATD